MIVSYDNKKEIEKKTRRRKKKLAIKSAVKKTYNTKIIEKVRLNVAKFVC
jgi:hypothetical protein